MPEWVHSAAAAAVASAGYQLQVFSKKLPDIMFWFFRYGLSSKCYFSRWKHISSRQGHHAIKIERADRRSGWSVFIRPNNAYIGSVSRFLFQQQNVNNSVNLLKMNSSDFSYPSLRICCQHNEPDMLTSLRWTRYSEIPSYWFEERSNKAPIRNNGTGNSCLSTSSRPQTG